MSSKPIQKRASSEAMQVTVGECALGSVLVAASPRGVCAVLLGDDTPALWQDLQRRFPEARLMEGDRAHQSLAEEVARLVAAPGRSFDLPLDVRGTDFQQRVWRTLRLVPAGTTTTYTEIAHRIGSPKAVRAVAGACAANPVAVAIPCHRVVRCDGGISGYRWGVERKRALLQRESAA